MFRRAVCQIVIDVSEEQPAPILYSEDGRSVFFGNAGNYLLNYTI
jgi:hypothetical protein